MNVLEFNRWAEGQHGMAAVPALDHVQNMPSEEIDEPGKARANVIAGTEESRSRAVRFLGTLRWGK